MIRVDWLITGLNIIGGAEQFTAQLAFHLAKRGIHIRVITLRSGGVLIPSLRKQGIPVIEIGIRNKYNLLPLFRLLNLWRVSPPNILHTHLFHAGVIGRIIARCTGIQHVIVHQHGTENNRNFLRSSIDRLTSGMVDRYIVPSNAVGNVLIHREHIGQSKINLIHYGIEVDPPISASTISNWPSPPGVPVIGCVSRLVKEKSHPTLLKALHLLKQQGVQFHAIMIGDGPERETLAHICQKLEITECVSWVGIQHNVLSWLLHFDIFVLASAWEGMPISILEAMAAQVPVIATAVGGTPEVVIPGKTGILVPPDDPEHLSQAIDHLIQDSSLRTVMGIAGRKRVIDCFSISSTVDNILKLYAELTGKMPLDDDLSKASNDDN